MKSVNEAMVMMADMDESAPRLVVMREKSGDWVALIQNADADLTASPMLCFEGEAFLRGRGDSPETALAALDVKCAAMLLKI